MTTTAISDPSVASPSRGLSTWLSPASFEAAEQIAGLMSRCGTMPKHLVGKPADCFRIVVQAAKWQLDPFVVAECTSLVHGRLCYEGKLVAAVLRTMNVLDGHLKYEITGEGQGASIVITGKLRDGTVPPPLKGSVQQWRTNPKDDQGRPIKNAWDSDPISMLVYRGTRQWARLWASEAILGVYTPDEHDETIKEAEVIHTTTADPKPAKRGGGKDKIPEKPADTQETKPAPANGPMGEVTAIDLRVLADSRDPKAVAEVLAKYNLKSVDDASTSIVRAAVAAELAKLPAAESGPSTVAEAQRPTQKELNDLARKLLVAGPEGQKRLREVNAKWKLQSTDDMAGEGDAACIEFHAELVAECKAIGAIQ